MHVVIDRWPPSIHLLCGPPWIWIGICRHACLKRECIILFQYYYCILDNGELVGLFVGTIFCMVVVRS